MIPKVFEPPAQIVRRRCKQGSPHRGSTSRQSKAMKHLYQSIQLQKGETPYQIQKLNLETMHDVFERRKKDLERQLIAVTQNSQHNKTDIIEEKISDSEYNNNHQHGRSHLETPNTNLQEQSSHQAYQIQTASMHPSLSMLEDPFQCSIQQSSTEGEDVAITRNNNLLVPTKRATNDTLLLNDTANLAVQNQQKSCTETYPTELDSPFNFKNAESLQEPSMDYILKSNKKRPERDSINLNIKMLNGQKQSQGNEHNTVKDTYLDSNPMEMVSERHASIETSVQVTDTQHSVHSGDTMLNHSAMRKKKEEKNQQDDHSFCDSPVQPINPNPLTIKTEIIPQHNLMVYYQQEFSPELIANAVGFKLRSKKPSPRRGRPRLYESAETSLKNQILTPLGHQKQQQYAQNNQQSYSNQGQRKLGVTIKNGQQQFSMWQNQSTPRVEKQESSQNQNVKFMRSANNVSQKAQMPIRSAEFTSMDTGIYQQPQSPFLKKEVLKAKILTSRSPVLSDASLGTNKKVRNIQVIRSPRKAQKSDIMFSLKRQRMQGKLQDVLSLKYAQKDAQGNSQLKSHDSVNNSQAHQIRNKQPLNSQILLSDQLKSQSNNVSVHTRQTNNNHYGSRKQSRGHRFNTLQDGTPPVSITHNQEYDQFSASTSVAAGYSNGDSTDREFNPETQRTSGSVHNNRKRAILKPMLTMKDNVRDSQLNLPFNKNINGNAQVTGQQMKFMTLEQYHRLQADGHKQKMMVGQKYNAKESDMNVSSPKQVMTPDTEFQREIEQFANSVHGSINGGVDYVTGFSPFDTNKLLQSAFQKQNPCLKFEGETALSEKSKEDVISMKTADVKSNNTSNRRQDSSKWQKVEVYCPKQSQQQPSEHPSSASNPIRLSKKQAAPQPKISADQVQSLKTSAPMVQQSIKFAESLMATSRQAIRISRNQPPLMQEPIKVPTDGTLSTVNSRPVSSNVSTTKDHLNASNYNNDTLSQNSRALVFNGDLNSYANKCNVSVSSRKRQIWDRFENYNGEGQYMEGQGNNMDIDPLLRLELFQQNSGNNPTSQNSSSNQSKRMRMRNNLQQPVELRAKHASKKQSYNVDVNINSPITSPVSQLIPTNNTTSPSNQVYIIGKEGTMGADYSQTTSPNLLQPTLPQMMLGQLKQNVQTIATPVGGGGVIWSQTGSLIESHAFTPRSSIQARISNDQKNQQLDFTSLVVSGARNVVNNNNMIIPPQELMNLQNMPGRCNKTAGQTKRKPIDINNLNQRNNNRL